MTLPSLPEQLAQLVALPSVSSHSPRWDTSNRPVVECLAGWLTDLGFHCELLPVAGHEGKLNLIASLGSGPGGLVLAGHTDTVPYDDSRWQTDPFTLTEKDGKWYGLGATDMKGFFPVAIAAASAFKNSVLKQPLIILATADEESSMSGAKALVELGRPKARQAVIGEPTGLVPIRMHKGIMMEEIRVVGQSGHSSDPALGNNAMEVMHQVLSEVMAFRREIQGRYQHAGFSINVPTLNLGCIHGGDNPNRICGECALQFDLRSLPGMDNRALREEILHRIKPLEAQTGTRIDMKTLFGGVPAYEEPETAAIVAAAERLTGHTAGSVAFATEAPFLQQLGMDTLVLGPGSIDQAHQPDEFIDIAQIDPAITILQGLIREFCL